MIHPTTLFLIGITMDDIEFLGDENFIDTVNSKLSNGYMIVDSSSKMNNHTAEGFVFGKETMTSSSKDGIIQDIDGQGPKWVEIDYGLVVDGIFPRDYLIFRTE